MLEISHTSREDLITELRVPATLQKKVNLLIKDRNTIDTLHLIRCWQSKTKGSKVADFQKKLFLAEWLRDLAKPSLQEAKAQLEDAQNAIKERPYLIVARPAGNEVQNAAFSYFVEKVKDSGSKMFEGKESGEDIPKAVMELLDELESSYFEIYYEYNKYSNQSSNILESLRKDIIFLLTLLSVKQFNNATIFGIENNWPGATPLIFQFFTKVVKFILDQSKERPDLPRYQNGNPVFRDEPDDLCVWLNQVAKDVMSNQSRLDRLMVQG